MTENLEKNEQEKENNQKSVTEKIIEFLQSHYPDPAQMKSVRAMTKEIFDAIGIGSLNSVHIAMNKWRQIAREKQLQRSDASMLGYDELAAKLPDIFWSVASPLIEAARRLQREEDDAEINRLQQENEVFIQEQENALHEREEYEHQIALFSQQIQQYEDDFHGFEDKLSKAQEENIELKKEIARLNEKTQALSGKIEQLQEESVQTEAAKQTLEHEVVRLTAELKHLENLPEQLREVQENLGKNSIELALTSQQLATERELKALALTEKETLKKDLTELRAKCDDAIASAAAANSQKEYLLQTIETLKAAKKSARTKNKTQKA